MRSILPKSENTYSIRPHRFPKRSIYSSGCTDIAGPPPSLTWSRSRFATFSMHRIAVLKYFPIGFLATPSRAYDGLPSLSRYRNAGRDEEIGLSLPLGVRRPPDWPEAPSDDDGMVTLVGEAAATAVLAHSAT